MEEDELFDEFYAKLKDIVNLTFNLRETILKPKIVRKVLKSLPKRFHAKITAIKESKDIDKFVWQSWMVIWDEQNLGTVFSCYSLDFLS